MLDDLCLAPHAVARWAAERPDAVAVVRVEGGSRTYAAMLAESQRWAAALDAHGVGHGSHVATMLPNGFDVLDAWLAIGWLRAVEVPLNTAYQGHMLQYALATADVTFLVVDHTFVERVVPLLDALPQLRTVVVVGGEVPADAPPAVTFLTRDAFLAGHEPRPFDGPRYRDISAIIYTSGTTGPSKGVLVPWAGAYQMWSWVPDDTLLPGEGLYSAFQPFHIAGKSVNINCFVRGGRLVLRDKFSAASFLDDVRTFDCAAACVVGPMTAILHAQPRRPDDADNPLRSVLLGPMIPEMADFETRFGVRVATCYGMTEVGAVVNTTFDHGPWQTCGRARTDYPWTELRIVDELDEEVPLGEVGELVVRSAEPWALNAGYYNMPEKTAEAWRNGWFHTGDAFRCDEDGNYYFVDRMKDAIRRRGENISSFEVENAVLEHPDVVDCSAIGVPAQFGEDEVMVIVVAHDRATFDPHALVTWLDERMPRFMVPRYVEVVDDLPRNETSMRVKKMELRQQGVTPTTWDREAHRS